MTGPLHFGECPTSNTLYYGDCLEWMHEWASASVDLIYLDPPFNSKQNYNLLYSDTPGDAQAKAFEDTWTWDDTAESRFERFDLTSGPLPSTIRGLMRCLGRSGMLAYLTYMAERLDECHRLLKPTGSIYLHCDPTASHYLKVVMDSIFGAKHFRGEITWQRTTTHNDAKRWSPNADIILYFARSKSATWNPVYLPYSGNYIASKYRHKDGDGRRYRLDNMTSPNPRPNLTYEWKGFVSPPKGWRYSRETMEQLDNAGRIWYPDSKNRRPQLKRFLDEQKGVVAGNIWTDISPVNSQARERLGYPTQKPLALLERIIRASSNPGDLVLDPFCGCGTTIEAAERLSRRWAGIDISLHAVNVIRRERLPDTHIEVDGIPTDMHSARHHAAHSPFRFEQWAVECVPGFVANTKQRGDGGVDGWGRLAVRPEGGLTRTAVAQVKGGKWKVDSLKAFCTVTRQRKAAVGCYITLDQLTADSARQIRSQEGYIKVAGNRYPRMSLWSIERYFGGEIHGPLDLPMLVNVRTGKPMDQGALF